MYGTVPYRYGTDLTANDVELLMTNTRLRAGSKIIKKPTCIQLVSKTYSLTTQSDRFILTGHSQEKFVTLRSITTTIPEAHLLAISHEFVKVFGHGHLHGIGAVVGNRL
jgi:hypothetical protein